MGASSVTVPDAMVSTDWLNNHLLEPDLRVFDCTTHLVLEAGNDGPYSVVSGRPDYDASHIPGAGYLELQADFSVQDSPFRFTLQAPDEAAAAFGRHGVDDETAVVLYSRKTPMWATRFWWMLRWLGFDNAAILDGGFDKWAAEDRPLSGVPCRYSPGTLTPKTRPDLFVGRDELRAGIGGKNVCTINALSPDLHAGENPRYGRPGRVPGSVNLPAGQLVKPETKEFVSLDVAADAFADIGADDSKKILAYCGGGIAATVDAFMLTRLGYPDVAVYDNSMSEWATDPSLPIETD